jgi:hypothetical protein
MRALRGIHFISAFSTNTAEKQRRPLSSGQAGLNNPGLFGSTGPRCPDPLLQGMVARASSASRLPEISLQLPWQFFKLPGVRAPTRTEVIFGRLNTQAIAVSAQDLIFSLISDGGDRRASDSDRPRHGGCLVACLKKRVVVLPAGTSWAVRYFPESRPLLSGL